MASERAIATTRDKVLQQSWFSRQTFARQGYERKQGFVAQLPPQQGFSNRGGPRQTSFWRHCIVACRHLIKVLLDVTGKAGSQAELPFFVAELPEGKRLGNLIAVCTQIGAGQGCC